MADMRQPLGVFRRHCNRPSAREVRKVATIVVEVVAAAITDRMYIHMVPVAVRLHAHLPAATVDDDSRILADQVDRRIAVVPEQCIMGMVEMAEVSNIIHRKMSRTSQFQHKKIYDKNECNSRRHTDRFRSHHEQIHYFPFFFFFKHTKLRTYRITHNCNSTHYYC